ncbi:hypothetical protein [Pseudomonas sp. C9-3]|uniref:hypothetical protein n=1 Tax=Pseudomonas sp. C9-3 TaxID=3078264 RepID=UPI0028E846A6|nr:hypothetical protein [Pseudomonas sp. C9-3]
MQGIIPVTVEVQRHQALAYLRWLDNQYQLAMAEAWYTDRYRHTPQGERARAILLDHPHIVGIYRTRRALRLQLGFKP